MCIRDRIPCFVESNSEEDVQLLKDIASALSEKVYEASSEQRKSLHLAAVFTCNFTNHMYVSVSYTHLVGLLFSKQPLPPQRGRVDRDDETVVRQLLLRAGMLR